MMFKVIIKVFGYPKHNEALTREQTVMWMSQGRNLYLGKN